MRILLLGLSRIARRRVLPAFSALKDVDAVDIASRTASDGNAVSESLRGNFYTRYEEALAESTADLVYVSLVNRLHAEWATRALKHGRHVVVDKPCALTPGDAESLVDEAAKRQLCLAEATVFPFHPQFRVVQEMIRSLSPESLRVSATFSFPPMPGTDFRYSEQAGGGSLNDLGPYAVATARLLFRQSPRFAACKVLARQQGVDRACSLMMTFAGGGSLVGRFGFDTEYCNRLSVLAPGISLEIDRIYSIPADTKNEMVVRRNNVEERVLLPSGDSFANFLGYVVERIQSGNCESLARDLIADAALLDRLRRTALEI